MVAVRLHAFNAARAAFSSGADWESGGGGAKYSSISRSNESFSKNKENFIKNCKDRKKILGKIN